MLKKLQTTLKNQKLDALLITTPSNVEYMTCFTGSNKTLLVTKNNAYLITDSRYLSRAKKEIKDAKSVKLINSKNTIETLKELTVKFKRIGFEAHTTTIASWKKLKKAFKGNVLVPTEQMIENFRQKKYEFEIELITRACEITSQIFQEIRPYIKLGMTEREVAWKIRDLAFRRGIDEFAFDPIVAFGKNSALPHHKTGSAKLKSTEIILLDFGVKYRGYCSDMTRVILPKNAPEKLKRIYNACSEAKETAAKMIKPGMKFSEADHIARKVLKKYGYEKYFTHSLGHGLGIDIHEKPSLHSKSEGVFEDGMVFTIEPGIYVERLGGVRLEDTYWLRKGRAVRLTK